MCADEFFVLPRFFVLPKRSEFELYFGTTAMRGRGPNGAVSADYWEA